MVSGNHLVQFRWIQQPGPFPAHVGLGVYSYRMTDGGLVPTNFLPCFEGGEMWLSYHDEGLKQIHKVSTKMPMNLLFYEEY
jgi:hypothetical protein